MSELSTGVTAKRESAPAWGEILRRIALPVLSVFTAVIIGGIFIYIAGYDPLQAYGGLLDGAFGDGAGLVRTFVKMTPLVFSGLAVAVAFKGGLFNIGVQGQLIMGSVTSAWVGFALPVDLGNPVLSTIVHVILALLAGALGGALWGAIPGILKAYTGAHEVITTIMFNFIASNFINWLLYAGSSASTCARMYVVCRRTMSRFSEAHCFIVSPVASLAKDLAFLLT